MREGLSWTHPLVILTLVAMVATLSFPSLFRRRWIRKRERLLDQYHRILALAEQQQAQRLEESGADDAP